MSDLQLVAHVSSEIAGFCVASLRPAPGFPLVHLLFGAYFEPTDAMPCVFGSPAA